MRLLVLLPLVLLGSALRGEEPPIVLFTEPQFKGLHLELTESLENTSTLPDLHKGSMQVSPAYKVELFPQPHFQGQPISTRTSLESLDIFEKGPRSIRLTWLGHLWPRLAEDTTQGVTLFAEADLSGDYQVLQKSVTHLGKTSFGKNRACSLVVAPGYEAVLFSKTRYRGTKIFLSSGIHKLADTELGCNQLASIRIVQQLAPHSRIAKPKGLPPVDRNYSAVPVPNVFVNMDGTDSEETVVLTTGLFLTTALVQKVRATLDKQQRRTNPAQPGPGITLYSANAFQGQSLKIYQNIRDMRETHLGDNRTNSLTIPEGYVVTLYEGPNYSGRYITAEKDIADMAATELGPAEISSLRIVAKEDAFTHFQ